MYELIREHLSDEDIDKFALWAFGEGYKDLDRTQMFMEAWNERHIASLELSPIGSPEHDIKHMIRLWKENNL